MARPSASPPFRQVEALDWREAGGPPRLPTPLATILDAKFLLRDILCQGRMRWRARLRYESEAGLEREENQENGGPATRLCLWMVARMLGVVLGCCR